MTKLSFRLLLGCLVWFIPQFANALTAGDILVQIRQQIDDRADPNLRYSDKMLYHFINEAQRDVVNKTWCLEKTHQQTLSVRTTYYAFPDDYIAIREFNFKDSVGRQRQLEEKSERGLYQENPDYERQQGAPFYYFTRYSTSTATRMEFGINPVPSSSTVTGTALIKYYAQPTDVSVSTDVPLGGHQFLYPYHTAITHYTIGKIKLLQGDASGAAVYMGIYETDIKLMRDRINSAPNYFPGFQSSGGR